MNAWFRRLAQIDNNDWVPPALWALRHHGDDPLWLDGFFRALERLAASMFVRRIYTTPRVSRYAALLHDLANGKGLEAPAFELGPDERADTLAQLDGNLYLVTKIRKYVLLRLDEVAANGSGVKYDVPLITVEHVLPQSPKPGSRWLADFTTADRADWTHRIANLVLLNRAKNSQASNYDFVDKKEKYFRGGLGVANFAVTVEVLNHSAWTPEVLHGRQRELLKALACEWNL
ncbi:MAG: HNH endonuclease family protein [Umezawaea sp.]